MEHGAFPSFQKGGSAELRGIQSQVQEFCCKCIFHKILKIVAGPCPQTVREGRRGSASVYHSCGILHKECSILCKP